jgi:hypothetical protein
MLAAVSGLSALKVAHVRAITGQCEGPRGPAVPGPQVAAAPPG